MMARCEVPDLTAHQIERWVDGECLKLPNER
jgi:hypothetical protein